ncbi:hypothetical protein [Halobacillus sp. Marseille-Q1614]|uniref:hypothetical protein n=1 Tax=Halobacillus sp. Marseille-Q1614 TaxID=2709134 RepID=UPI00156E6E70|nr:hypothetical protein [Halobacillus sp. Marseille-Q1614]
MKYLKLLILPLMVFILSGCLYPQSEMSKNQLSNQEQLESIQNAVYEYQSQTNLLPIKTREQDTQPFLKYPIDFSKLRERGLIGEAPGNSFENGGHYQYIIIHAEDNPVVKVVDLKVTEALRSLQMKVEYYVNENKYPPLNNKIARGVYDLKYEQMGLDEKPTVDSPYSDKKLPIYINERGELLVDYRPELYELMRNEEHDYETGDDIRYLLTDHTPFAPAYSPAYTIEGEEPVFAEDLSSS